jgi:hypothetical protein
MGLVRRSATRAKQASYMVGAEILRTYRRLFAKPIGLAVLANIVGDFAATASPAVAKRIGKWANHSAFITKIEQYVAATNHFGSSALVAPVVEELLFRGVTSKLREGLHKLIEECNAPEERDGLTIEDCRVRGAREKWIASLVLNLTQATVFGMLHAWNVPKEDLRGGFWAIQAFLGGLIYGAVEEKYGLLSSVALHSGPQLGCETDTGAYQPSRPRREATSPPNEEPACTFQ